MMNEPTAHGDIAYGTAEQIGDRTALRFESTLNHPVERVWQAVSTPAELAKFFPGAAPWTPVAGEVIDLGGLALQVHEVVVPTRLAWTFAGEDQSFDLAPTADGGCTLTFAHVFDDLPVAQTAAGWHVYLARLAPHLDGEAVSEEVAHQNWLEIHDAYAAKFGLDPEPGRRWANENLRGD